MKFFSNIFKKNKDRQHLDDADANDELVDSEQKVIVPSRKSKRNSVGSISPTGSSSPRSGKKNNDGNCEPLTEEEDPVPTIICISNLKGLQKYDRKWLTQSGIKDEVINDNFPIVVHVLNFLRRKDFIYYKYVEQPEQIAQLKEMVKDQVPSVVVTSSASSQNSPNYSSSDEEDEAGGGRAKNNLSIPRNAAGSQSPGVIVTSANTNSGGPSSFSFIYTENTRRIDSGRIFMSPGVFFKFPEELETATERILNEGNPKEQYKNLDFEARGGFGSVYAAKNKNPHCANDKQMVALKKMPHRTLKQKRMNLTEISFMKYCRHPNIADFICSYQRNDELWMIMEFLEGGTLSDAIHNFTFCESKIAYVAREILRGIHYLHANNICHRDLKSSNIMISLKGDIKIIDFGLAIDFSIEKEDIHMCGSPYWMPPEQIHGRPHSFSADIWSFGVCVVEMLKRRLPNHNSRLKSMVTTATEGLVLSREEHAEWSDEVYDFVHRCIQFDPQQRATAEQLLEHPFLTKACDLKDIKEILPALFMSNTLSKQGLF
ncbi:hypothetical protein SAMD00019534_044210 [Acytostelium subglobosum LB1]|uniref:hypothetical protein n=1 Tax=Acytostelium subglobosum LB1 TaxID=1410327 RepID=UPI0006448353|nr:hypothetical protein SAMD00019534_044210 [Acytostelium subglobosum LB1]GAM21246.1 hypothetical protein SAMD00019534_044210 [Acytostelium subglobosum LB1]|eukprot:XP_012755365.1 hypothetical protein SAMD00019534_044210 [Acytostelium subglobosum LB1]